MLLTHTLYGCYPAYTDLLTSTKSSERHRGHRNKMGNCCCGGNDEKGGSGRNAFQGEGHRLGTSDDVPLTQQPSPDTMNRHQNDPTIPEPAYDANMTEEQRRQQRADRAAAAEKRLKSQGGGTTTTKKKKDTSNQPLRGPNSKPTMTWTAG